MFHTYVRTFSKRSVDFNRASFLMDKTLFQQALDAMAAEQATAPRLDASYGPQWVWDYYCERHSEKYGSSFAPDVNPDWDHDPPPRHSVRQQEELRTG